MSRPAASMMDHEPRPLPPGKLPASLLAELLSSLPTQDAQLVLGPAVGEDAAIIDFAAGNDQLLVAKIDPITFATDEIGYYAVNVCANDLAVTGATPRFYFPAVFLPADNFGADQARLIFDQIGAACVQHGIVVAGGHSEITHSVSGPVVAGAMLGEVARDGYVSTHGCRAGDVLLMAGSLPVEGTSIIARERRDVLLARGWQAAELDRAAHYLYDPGISVRVPAQAAAATGLVTAMHDPTEGGVATGLLELAVAAGVGLDVDLDSLPIADLSARLCAAFGLDPLGVIASGALLAACAPEDAAAVLEAWRACGWAGAVIGSATPYRGEYTARRGRQRVPFPQFAVDEITKLWA